MSDHRLGRRRRYRLAGVFEVSYFAQKHGISREQAERILKRARGNRQLASAIYALVKKQFLVA